VPRGTVHVKATFNNTIVSIADRPERDRVVVRRRGRLEGLAQEHSLRRPGRG